MEDAVALAPPGRCSQTDLRVLRSLVDRRLSALLPAASGGNELDRAMRYALLAPGKRIRPILTILAAWELGPRDFRALDAACALEMVHAASLVLDDMPCMDDAAFRRGQPATHGRFGEDVALLCVVSLLARAFGTLGAVEGISASKRGELVGLLARTVGSHGLARGQFQDLRAAARQPGESGIADLNHLKTGILFVCAVEMAAILHDVCGPRLDALKRCAGHLGQAFQLLDDLDDGEETREDAGKLGLIAFVGRAETRRRLEQHVDLALACVEPGGGLATLLRSVSDPILRPA